MDSIGHIMIQTVWISIPEFIRLAFTALTGGLLGVCVNDRLTRRREAERDKKLRAEKAADDKKVRDEQSRTDFRGFICGFKAQVGKVEDGRFRDWFFGMQIDVEKQCALVESAIGLDFRTRFAYARKECAKLQTEDDLADPRNPQLPVGVISFGADYLPPATYQSGRKRAEAILESLLEVCK